MLIGRDKERNMLLSALRSDKSEFVAVFGRRRVGKTYLVQESFRNSFAFVHKVINDHGGLHNRVTRQIRLRPFTLAECEALARRKGLRLNRTQILEGYMVMGGIPYYWDRLQISASQTGRIWYGFAFERVCLAHVAQMKKALGISGVATEEYAWRHFAEGENDKGAQIDLVIDRSDGVVNLCEMKYAKGRYAISPDYAERLVERAQTFADKVASGKSVFTTMVTPCGVRQDENSSVVQSEITAEDLFSD